MCETQDSLEDRHYIDANPDPDSDLDRHQHGNSDPDPDRHQNDADQQHWIRISTRIRIQNCGTVDPDPSKSPPEPDPQHPTWRQSSRFSSSFWLQARVRARNSSMCAAICFTITVLAATIFAVSASTLHYERRTQSRAVFLFQEDVKTAKISLLRRYLKASMERELSPSITKPIESKTPWS